MNMKQCHKFRICSCKQTMLENHTTKVGR